MKATVDLQVAEPECPKGWPIRALVAEDNPVFQSVLFSMLTRWGYDTVVAQDGNEAWEILQSSNPPRLAVLDWVMPGIDGVEICRRIRAAGNEPYVYILLLTARTDSKDLVEGMEAGADDYVTKPFNLHELRVRLRAGRRILELQDELLRAREELRERATHDSLTGLYNRCSILDSLQKELLRANRENHPIAVLMADLDMFKQVNDTYGHLAGDRVLAEAAQRMQSSIRRYDAIGRYGGEEFLIVLTGCAQDEAESLAWRTQAAIGSQPYVFANGSTRVTGSVGLSWRAAPSPGDMEPLIHEADEALYQAKRDGRNRVCTMLSQGLEVL